MRFLIGTYTEGSQAIPNDKGERSQGVYTCAFDGSTAEIQGVTPATNPSFLAQHPTLPVIYVVVERSGNPGGVIASYRIGAGGTLEPVSETPSLGDDPCHLMVAPDGRYLVATNYSSGDFTSVSIDDDGHVEGMISYMQHWGHSVDPVRQTRPHAHSSGISPDGAYLFVADLGTDQISRYPISEKGVVDSNGRRSMRVSAGAGPRHFCFDPENEDMYVINELNSTITRLTRDPRAVLIERRSLSTVPADYSDANYTAHICVSPDGRFLYGSNRGHDSIVVVPLNPGLVPVQYAETGGQHPRHFACTDDQIIVANRDTGNVCGFARDADSGRIGKLLFEVSVPSPSFVLPISMNH